MMILVLFIGLLSRGVAAQNTEVIGKVTAFKKIPVFNADVLIKNSKKSVRTDSLGFFRIECQNKAKLSISANGFYKQNVVVNLEEDTLRINLVLKDGAKNQKIATGYGHISKDQMSYAISNLPDENIKYEFYATIFDMLKSKASGVTVSGNNVTIRGVNTIGGVESPLFVVDGFVVDYMFFKNINPQDVKTISVLKDAAASARYGSRGMHGVIVITMKKS